MPDREAHRIEDSIACYIASAKPKDLFPLRPGYGTLGQPNILHTNFAAICLPQQDLFCYEIQIESSFSCAEPKPATVRRLISVLLKLRFARERTLMATDFLSTLISCVEVPSTKSYRLIDSFEDRRTDTHSRGLYKISFRLRCKSSSQVLSEYLNPALCETVLTTRPELRCTLQKILSFYANGKAFEMNIASDSPQLRSSLSRRELGSSSIAVKIYNATARMLLIVTAEQNLYRRSEPFSALIGKYLSSFPTRLDQLEKLLKDVRVHVRTSFRGRRHTTVRLIQGLATCTDGAHLRHPPKVSRFGAGPEDVEVFQESSHASLSQTRSGHGYISLKAYFEQSKILVSLAEHERVIDNLECGITLNPDLPVINVGTLEQPLYCPVELCEAQPEQLLVWLSARAHQCQRRPSRTLMTEINKDPSMAGWHDNWNARLVSTMAWHLPVRVDECSSVEPVRLG